jgi:pimeloyl-ACP methyl ester carboxylesterase
MFKRNLVGVLVALAIFGMQAVPASAARSTTVLFVGGYGSTLGSAAQVFTPLRDALLARDPATMFALYSYAGWNAQTCAPLDYRAEATGQDFETSKQRLLETINTLHAACGADRIVVIGHSLGGLIAFHALSDNPMGEVSEVVTVDSPLGGAPAVEVRACVDAGLCVEGRVGGLLADLHGAWDQTSLDNTARVRSLAAAGTRVTAWGNQSDCLYAPSLCIPLARALVGAYDVRDTQWLGIDRAMRRDIAPRSTLASVLNTHLAVLSTAATDIATELFG